MLVAHFPLNGDARNYRGFAGHGVATGVDWVTGKLGLAPDFTGTAGKLIQVEHGGELDFPNDAERTVSAFIKVSSTSGWKTFFAPAPDGSTNNYQYVLTVNNVMQVEVWRQGGIMLLQSDTTLNLGQWYHIIFTFGDGELSLYIDGELDTVEEMPNLGYTYNSTHLNIGGRPTTEHFNGLINDVRIYDKVLSTKEIIDLSKGLVFHYSLDDEYRIPTVNLLQPNDFRASSFQGYPPFVIEQIDEPLAQSGKGLKLQLPSDAGSFNQAGRVMFNVSSEWTQEGRRFSISFFAKGMGSTIGKPPKIYFGTWLTSNDLLEEDYKRFVFENIPITVYNQVGIGLRQDWALGDIWYIHSPQIEEKSKATPFTSTERDGGAYDLAGYYGNSELSGDFSYIDDSPILGGVKFNGVDTTINCDKILNLREQVSVCAWVRYEGDFHGGILIKGGESSWNKNSITFLRSTSGLYPQIRVSNGGSSDVDDIIHHSFVGSTDFSDGKWHHIAMTFANNILEVYLDGEKVKSEFKDIGILVDCADKDLIIGRQYGSGGSIFDGSVADIRVYETALSDNYVKYLSNPRISFGKSGNVWTYGVSEDDSFKMKKATFEANVVDETGDEKPQMIIKNGTLKIKGEISEVD